jgi:competence/damage-inducible protein CinA-like protein
LRSIGLDLYRSTVVGDNAERISAALRESLARAQIVITCGGLGPTIDDPTREAVAAAVGRHLEFREELWRQIQERFARFGRRPTENNRRQAYLPEEATALENRVGTAPAFYLEVDSTIVISLPGVPAELEILLEETVLALLTSRLDRQEVIKTRVLRTAGIGESVLDDRVHDLEMLSNPTVGLAAHPGRVDIRLTSKARSESEAAEALARLQATIQERLGEDIYGIDEQSLEGALGRLLRERDWRIASIEAGTDGALASALASEPDDFAGGLVLPFLNDTAEDRLQEWQQRCGAEVGIQVSLDEAGKRRRMRARILGPGIDETLERGYGGPLPSTPLWVVSIVLDHLRRILLKADA